MLRLDYYRVIRDSLIHRRVRRILRCGGSTSEEMVQFLVEVFLVLYRLDTAVFHLYVAVMLYDEATNGASLLIVLTA